MSNSSNTKVVIAGAPPRARLLPPEVGQRVRAKAQRRLLIFLTVLVTIITAGLVAGATVLSLGSATLLAQATDEGNSLLIQQGEYAEVRQVTSMIAKSDEGLDIGSITQIEWKSYFAEIQASLPAGTLITNFSAETASPTKPYAQPSVPLQGARVGELMFTATSPALPDIDAWLKGLENVTGFVDAAPGTVVLSDGGIYTVTIVMHINSEVYDNPFTRVDEDAEGEEG